MMISTHCCLVRGAANEQRHTHCFAYGQILATDMEVREAQDEALLHKRYQLDATLGSGYFSAVYRAICRLDATWAPKRQLKPPTYSICQTAKFTKATILGFPEPPIQAFSLPFGLHAQNILS